MSKKIVEVFADSFPDRIVSLSPLCSVPSFLSGRDAGWSVTVVGRLARWEAAVAAVTAR